MLISLYLGFVLVGFRSTISFSFLFLYLSNLWLQSCQQFFKRGFSVIIVSLYNNEIKTGKIKTLEIVYFESHTV